MGVIKKVAPESPKGQGIFYERNTMSISGRELQQVLGIKTFRTFESMVERIVKKHPSLDMELESFYARGKDGKRGRNDYRISTVGYFFLLLEVKSKEEWVTEEIDRLIGTLQNFPSVRKNRKGEIVPAALPKPKMPELESYPWDENETPEEHRLRMEREDRERLEAGPYIPESFRTTET